jgi:hypothetical protein
MEEIYHTYKNSINIPLMEFIKEKNKYKTMRYYKKRYLYENYEGVVAINGIKKCYKKELINHKKQKEKNIINWKITEIPWPNDIQWSCIEEYISEECSDNSINFITTNKGIRRIFQQKII